MYTQTWQMINTHHLWLIHQLALTSSFNYNIQWWRQGELNEVLMKVNSNREKNGWKLIYLTANPTLENCPELFNGFCHCFPGWLLERVFFFPSSSLCFVSVTCTLLDAHVLGALWAYTHKNLKSPLSWLSYESKFKLRDAKEGNSEEKNRNREKH